MKLKDIWSDYPVFEDVMDSVTVEVYEPWLTTLHHDQIEKSDNVARDFPEMKAAVDHGDHVHDER